MTRIGLWSTTAFLLSLLFCSTGLAADYYVDQNSTQASDSNPGTEALPWRTLQRAAEHDLAPGDTVHVKPGVYSAASSGDGFTPGILIHSSGTPGRPITFRSTVPHAAVITGNGAMGPLFGSMYRDHIVIDGFHIRDALKKGLIVYGDPNDRVEGVVIRNNRISGIRLDADSQPGDNTNGLRIEWASDILVRNNEIWDVYNPNRTTNASGIGMYNNRRTTIEHNYIHDTVAGIKEKEASDEVVMRYNLIRCNGAGDALVIENQSSPANPSGSASGRAVGFRFYQNVVRDCANGVSGGSSYAPAIGDVRIYNNVFYNLSDIGVRAAPNGIGRYVYNNIFHRVSHPAAEASGDVVTPHYGFNLYRDLKFSDYNLHIHQAKYVIGRYTFRQQQLFGLPQIQRATAYADNSLELVDPLFLDPAGGDFRLASSSPAIGAGRTVTIIGNLIRTGARVNIGAYVSGDENIGLLAPDGGGPVYISPNIGSTPATAARVGEPYTYDVDATGIPAPNYRLEQAPIGMTIDASSGLIDWLPTTTGNAPVQVVAESEAGVDSQSFTITVLLPADDGSGPAAPGQPAFRMVSADLSGATVEASWAPPSTGNTPIYRYAAGTNSGTIWAAQGEVSERQVVLQNVPLDGSYWLCVRAVDSAGRESEPACSSFDSPSSTPPGMPGTPIFQLSYGPASATVEAAWAQPTTGPVPTYRYTAGYDSGPAWSAQGTVAERRVILTNVPLGGSYWFCVRAVNALGQESADQACNSFQTAPAGAGAECSAPRPEWIWCDDFEQNRLASYFEASSSLTRRAGAGLAGSTGIVARFVPGVSEAGNLKVAFGRTPSAYIRPVDAGTRDYRDIYWRMYLRLPTSWQGGGGDKLSRATILARADWSQAMVASVWSGNDPGPEQNFLRLDPASGTDPAGNLMTNGYNDSADFRWLGAANSQTPIFAPEYRGQWHCIEVRARLNDPGAANGVYSLWINGRLEAERTNLNWVGNFADYGINAVFFENYWNASSPIEQERYIDNLVISTSRIGCDA